MKNLLKFLVPIAAVVAVAFTGGRTASALVSLPTAGLAARSEAVGRPGGTQAIPTPAPPPRSATPLPGGGDLVIGVAKCIRSGPRTLGDMESPLTAKSGQVGLLPSDRGGSLCTTPQLQLKSGQVG